MDEKEIINLRSVNHTTTSELCKGEESKKQENCDTEQSKTIARLERENRPKKDYQAQETVEDEVVMMCWENSEGSLVDEPSKETDIQDRRADDEMQKSKDEKNMPILHYMWGTD